jgi:WD40 repeat protein/serine/threonine protein kinase
MSQARAAAADALPAEAEALLLQFEKAWRSGAQPQLQSFVAPLPAAAHGSCDVGRRALLEELVMLDLEYRWKKAGAGNSPLSPQVLAVGPTARPRLEEYFRLYAELGSAASVSRELLAAEYRVRHRWGDRPGHSEYVARFAANPALSNGLLKEIDAELATEFAGKTPAAPLTKLAPTPRPAPGPSQLSTAAFIELLRRHRLLTDAQFQEIGSDLRRATEARVIARGLLERGWLTAYQVNQLFLGNGEGLLLGTYLLMERLGEGGTGQVFKARDVQHHRPFALKVIRRELLAEPEVIRRFYREVQLLRQLAHPNIVHACDAGRAGGNHYLVMEYVHGTDLARQVRQRGPLPAAQAIDYIRQAALGLAHLHQASLVHRDLKPHNLVVTRADRGDSQTNPWGIVKLLDLGLARIDARFTGDLHSLETQASSLTPVGAVLLGTLDYMAPEQALDFHRADIRADIYSLGCTLHFLLTGEAPFSGGTLAQRLLRHQQANPPVIEALRRDVPRGLGEVLRKMLAKRPEDRPQTPAEVAEALAPLIPLAQEQERRRSIPLAQLALPADNGISPFAVRPASPWRRLLTSTIAAGIVVSLLAVVLFGPGLGKRRYVRVAASKTNPLQEIEKPPAVDVEKETPAATPGAPLSASALVTQPAALDGVRSWTVETRGIRGAVTQLAYSPDRRWLAVASEDSVIRLYHPPSTLVGILIGHYQRGQPNVPIQLSWSPDSRYLASNGYADASVRIWEVESGRAVRSLELPGGVHNIAWSPDGRAIACASQHNRAVVLLDARTGRQLFSLEGHQGGVGAIAWAPAVGQAFLPAEAPATERQTGMSAPLILASGGEDRTIRLWDTASGRPLRTITGHTGYIRRIAWAPDGDRLASTAQGDDQVRVWDAKTGQQVATAPNRNPGGIVNLAWRAGSDRKIENTLAYCDGTAHLWEPASNRPPRNLPSGIFLNAVAWSDSKFVTVAGMAQGGGRGMVETWDTTTNTLASSSEGHQLWPSGQRLAWSPNGRILATVDYPLTNVSLWDAPTGALLRTLTGHNSHVMVAAWSPDGATLATGSLDNEMRLFDPKSGTLLRQCSGHTQGVLALAWSSDGKQLASGSADGTVRLWDPRIGPVRVINTGHGDGVRTLAWSPTDAQLATGGGEADRTVRFWNPGTGTALLQPCAHPHGLTALAWHPDGKSLAAGMTTGDSVFVWNTSNADRIHELKGQGGALAVDWLSGGDILAATCTDHKVRQWDTKTGQPLRTVALAAFGTLSPDRKTLAAFGWPTVRLWSAETARPGRTLLLIDRDQWLSIEAGGTYRATPAVVRELVYIVQTDRGQEMLTPEEFTRRYRRAP